mmetsp:Transcript_24609/g.26920  ORF Transcript_24609/g.26920 Transcript_24609/m.26920 type:complete len:825 (-) Transcript_24609:144-2618(-)
MTIPPTLGGIPPILPPRLPITAPLSALPGFPGALPAGIPGLPLPGVMPFVPPRFPLSFPLPGRPLAAAAAVTSSSGLDPNNDITCWSEHTSEEGRKYWYNSVTYVSTYEKPFCLKTPEERSIPPCPWKEYAAEGGKTYYSNGKESTWEMPEEYRLWKEKVEALEKKLQEEKQQRSGGDKASASTNSLSAQGTGTATFAPSQNSHPPMIKSNSTHSLLSKTKSEDVAQVTYASQAEASEAFKELLSHKNISTIAKMKEVQELCQNDPRWEALKTMGERKQALAEYQTKKLKQEKEAAKVKARKHKDAFLLMLAETTDIDARTKWKDAIDILKDDVRYKNVEDSREREELFREFILELEKKEREDTYKQKDRALTYVKETLQSIANNNNATQTASSSSSSTSSSFAKIQQLPALTYKSNWNDYRQSLSELVNSRAELRVLTENDLRKCFLDFVHQLEEKQRQEERKRREQFVQSVEQSKQDLRNALEQLTKDGVLNAFTRWKDFLLLSDVVNLPAYKDLRDLMVAHNPNSNGGNTQRLEEDFVSLLREMFDRIITRAQEQYKDDRRLIKKFAWDQRIDLLPETKYTEFKESLLRKSQMVEKRRDKTEEGLKEKEEFEVGADVSVSLTVTAPRIEDHPEEGEEIEEPETKKISESDENREIAGSVASRAGTSVGVVGTTMLSEVQSLLLSRPFNLKDIFDDLYDKMMVEYEEEKKRQKKLEEKYVSLLKEYFYLSDHVGVKWDDAKQKLQGRSAYDALSRSDRKRLFYSYMDELGEKLKQKSIAMKSFEVVEAGELSALPLNTQKESRKRDRSNSSTEFEKLVRMKK